MHREVMGAVGGLSLNTCSRMLRRDRYRGRSVPGQSKLRRPTLTIVNYKCDLLLFRL